MNLSGITVHLKFLKFEMSRYLFFTGYLFIV